jgi:hypothetical protein
MAKGRAYRARPLTSRVVYAPFCAFPGRSVEIRRDASFYRNTYSMSRRQTHEMM